MRTVQSWTCELGYGADTMFHRTYFLFNLCPIPMGFPFQLGIPFSRAPQVHTEYTLSLFLSASLRKNSRKRTKQWQNFFNRLRYSSLTSSGSPSWRRTVSQWKSLICWMISMALWMTSLLSMTSTRCLTNFFCCCLQIFTQHYCNCRLPTTVVAWSSSRPFVCVCVNVRIITCE